MGGWPRWHEGLNVRPEGLKVQLGVPELNRTWNGSIINYITNNSPTFYQAKGKENSTINTHVALSQGDSVKTHRRSTTVPNLSHQDRPCHSFTSWLQAPFGSKIMSLNCAKRVKKHSKRLAPFPGLRLLPALIIKPS